MMHNQNIIRCIYPDARRSNATRRNPITNIVDHARQELATFAERPFSPVDSLVLSWFSYLRIPDALAPAHSWEGMPLRDLFRAEHFDELFAGMWDIPSGMDLLAAMVASPRFRDARVMGYTEQFDSVAEQQFAAVTIQLAPDLAYVAYRGTDATLVGWKEDFNLAFSCPVTGLRSGLCREGGVSHDGGLDP